MESHDIPGYELFTAQDVVKEMDGLTDGRRGPYLVTSHCLNFGDLPCTRG